LRRGPAAKTNKNNWLRGPTPVFFIPPPCGGRGGEGGPATGSSRCCFVYPRPPTSRSRLRSPRTPRKGEGSPVKSPPGCKKTNIQGKPSGAERVRTSLHRRHARAWLFPDRVARKQRHGSFVSGQWPGFLPRLDQRPQGPVAAGGGPLCRRSRTHRGTRLAQGRASVCWRGHADPANERGDRAALSRRIRSKRPTRFRRMWRDGRCVRERRKDGPCTRSTLSGGAIGCLKHPLGAEKKKKPPASGRCLSRGAGLDQLPWSKPFPKTVLARSRDVFARRPQRLKAVTESLA